MSRKDDEYDEQAFEQVVLDGQKWQASLRMGVPIIDRVLEAIGKSKKDYLHLVYELWQEDVIPESVYLEELRKVYAQ